MGSPRQAKKAPPRYIRTGPGTTHPRKGRTAGRTSDPVRGLIQLDFDPVAPAQGDTVRSYLEGFDARTVIVMELRFNHDLSFRDIGTRVGMDPATVRQLILDTLEQLRESMGGE